MIVFKILTGIALFTSSIYSVISAMNGIEIETQFYVSCAVAIVSLIFLILMSILSARLKKANGFTKEEQRAVDAAVRQDMENRAKNEKATEENRKQYKTMISGAKAKVKRKEEELKEARAAVYADRSLSDDDKSLYAVDYLIDAIKSGRASSKKEALQLYDVKARADREASARRAHEDMMRRQARWDRQEAQRRMDEHNRNMEYAANEAAAEARRARKVIEDALKDD